MSAPRVRKLKIYLTDRDWDLLCDMSRDSNQPLETVIRLALRTEKEWRAGKLAEAECSETGVAE